MNAFTTRTEAILALVLALVLSATTAGAREDIDPEGDKDHNRPEHGSLGNVGAKLADPTSDVWAMTMNFQGPQFFDGDLNTGDPEVGGGVIMEPVMPFPLYGTGEDQWKLITRPVIPILFSQPSRRASTSSSTGAVWGTSSCPSC